MGVEPRHLHVRNHPGRELHGHEDHVLDALLQVAVATRRNRRRSCSQQEPRNRDVVRPEAPERVFVRPHLSQVDALTVQVVRRSQLAALQHLAQPNDSRMEQEQVSRDHVYAGAVGELRNFSCGCAGERERLFH